MALGQTINVNHKCWKQPWLDKVCFYEIVVVTRGVWCQMISYLNWIVKCNWWLDPGRGLGSRNNTGTFNSPLLPHTVPQFWQRYCDQYTTTTRLVQTDQCFVSFSTCNPNTCSHWLTQSQKEADIYYLFIIGWHTFYFSSYWLIFIDLTLLHMSRLRWKLVLVEN